MTKFKTVNFNDKWPIKILNQLAVADVSQWKFWEKERLAHMYTAIRPNDLVLDIGSCNGEMSALFALWGAKVILVEPSPDFWPIIKAHFDENGLIPYQAFPVLVSNETTESIIPLPFELTPSVVKDSGWPTSASGELKQEVGFSHLNEKPKIPVMKIDDMKLKHVDVITMDIEGSEYEALEGAEETIKRDKPILFISVHPEFMWREHHHSPDDLLVMLTKWGYDMTYLAFDHEQHYLGKPRP